MVERKKIVHVSYYFHPEMGYDINLIGKYHSEEYDYVIITSDILTPWGISAKEIEEEDRAFEKTNKVKIIRCNSSTPTGRHSVYMKRLRKTIMAEKPSIAFFHGIEAYTYFHSLLTLPRRIKIFGDTHTLRSQFQDMSFLGKVLYWVFKRLVVPRINKDPNLFFYTAIENKDILIKDFGMDEHRIHDNEISVDPHLFYPKDPDYSLIPGLDGSRLTLGYVGKFDFYKEPHLILEAISALKLEQKINLVFIGPRDTKYMEEKWDESGLNKENISIFYLDSVKNQDLVNYYALYDFLVIPRFNSLSSLDIQACGKPLIMEKDDTNELRCKEGGLLYDSGSIEELAGVMRKLLMEDSLRKKLSEGGQKYVKENYNYISKLRKIESLY